jgi:hypothetical protein
MRRILALLTSLALAALLAGCASDTKTTAPNANGAAANSNGNAAGAREGTGPQGTGIGGTSEANRNSSVSGNSNVEPTGVNKNVGATPPAANRNR